VGRRGGEFPVMHKAKNLMKYVPNPHFWKQTTWDIFSRDWNFCSVDMFTQIIAKQVLKETKLCYKRRSNFSIQYHS